MTTKQTLLYLAARVDALAAPDNRLDVMVAVALHEPGQHEIRSNFAGTKVIYTRVSDNKEETFLADDWTADNRRTDASRHLRARAAELPEGDE